MHLKRIHLLITRCTHVRSVMTHKCEALFTYTIVIISAAAQKCVFEYVSVSIRDVICLAHEGHFIFSGCGPTLNKRKHYFFAKVFNKKKSISRQ
jgi:hypothetical protein